MNKLKSVVVRVEYNQDQPAKARGRGKAKITTFLQNILSSLKPKKLLVVTKESRVARLQVLCQWTNYGTQRLDSCLSMVEAWKGNNKTQIRSRISMNGILKYIPCFTLNLTNIVGCRANAAASFGARNTFAITSFISLLTRRNANSKMLTRRYQSMWKTEVSVMQIMSYFFDSLSSRNSLIYWFTWFM